MRFMRSTALLAAAFCLFGTVLPDLADAAVTRTTRHLNMRFGPGVDYRRVTTIPPGNVVNVTGCKGNWCFVSWRRHQGYVNARYLSTHVTTITSPTAKFGQ